MGDPLTHIYVSMQPDADGYPPVSVEELDATALGGGRFRIEGIPIFARGLAVGDVVRVAKVDGDDRYWVYEMVESADHWTVRLLPAKHEEPDQVAAEMARLGVASHPTPYRLVVVDLPPSDNRDHVYRSIEEGLAGGRWQVQIGNP